MGVTTTVRGGKYSTTTTRRAGRDRVVAVGGVGVEGSVPPRTGIMTSPSPVGVRLP